MYTTLLRYDLNRLQGQLMGFQESIFTLNSKIEFCIYCGNTSQIFGLN